MVIPPVFLFIVGSGRSGTTLLRAMFDAHPQMAVTHEAHFVAAMGRRRKRYERPHGLAVERFVADLFEDKKFRGVGLHEGEVREALAAPPAATYADAVRRVFALHARRYGKPRYGDKTPGYVLRIPLLAGLFPEARFIHIIRDGRDVATAFSDVRFGPHGVAETAIYWKRRVSRGRRAGHALSLRRYREIRYEDLVAEPETVLHELCDFTDLEFDPAMLRYFEQAGRSVGDTGIPEAHQRLLLPPTRGLRNWRDEMSRDDVRLFEGVAGDLLADLGYSCAFERLSLADRVGARWSWFRWQGWRARYNMGRLLPSGGRSSPRRSAHDAAGDLD